MKAEHKSVVVLTDQNPVNVTLGREIRTIKNISLVYFKLQGFDVDNPPRNLWIKVDGISTPSPSLVVNSTNVESGANRFKPKGSNTVPLFTKLGQPYTDSGGNSVQYQILHGVQPKGMRWKATDISDLTNFTITVLDDNNNAVQLAANAKLEFVFDAEWLPSQLQSFAWKTDRTYMNSMNA
jgi:hypothetical protein